MNRSRYFTLGSQAAFALAALLALPTMAARAQAPQDSFSANRFAPAPGAGNFLQVDGAQVRTHLQPSFGLTLDYAHEPLVVHTVSCSDPVAGTGCQVDGVRSELVSFAATANLWGALTISERVQVSLLLPVVFLNGDGLNATGRGAGALDIAGGGAAGLGDPRIGVKVRLLGEEGDVFHLAAATWLTLPLGEVIQEGRFLGNPGVTVGGHLVAEVESDGFHLALNAGGMWREEQTLLSTNQGPEIYYRAAVGYDVHPDVLLFAEIDGATGLTGDYDENPLEGRLAARVRHHDWAFTLAGGAGILGGVGVPVFRVVGGVSFAPTPEAPPQVEEEPEPELTGCRPADVEESPFDHRPACASPDASAAESAPNPEPEPEADPLEVDPELDPGLETDTATEPSDESGAAE